VVFQIMTPCTFDRRLPIFRRYLLSPSSLYKEMKVTCLFETLVTTYQITACHNPEDHNVKSLPTGRSFSQVSVHEHYVSFHKVVMITASDMHSAPMFLCSESCLSAKPYPSILGVRHHYLTWKFELSTDLLCIPEILGSGLGPRTGYPE
jgi:hypothetical protein